MGMNPLGLTLEPGKSRFHLSTEIVRLIYQRDGFKGYYRGYVASLCAYVPNSALWWGLYTVYQGDYNIFYCLYIYMLNQCKQLTILAGLCVFAPGQTS